MGLFQGLTQFTVQEKLDFVLVMILFQGCQYESQMTNHTPALGFCPPSRLFAANVEEQCYKSQVGVHTP